MIIRPPLLAIASALGLALIALSGCSSRVDPTAGVGYTMTFADYEDAAGNWKEDMPGWVPPDSTAVRVRAVNNGDTIILRVDSRSTPVGEDCTKGARESTPNLGAAWIPEELPTDVMRCGGFEIMPVEDGWLGWHVASEATPSPHPGSGGDEEHEARVTPRRPDIPRQEPQDARNASGSRRSADGDAQLSMRQRKKGPESQRFRAFICCGDRI